MEEQGMEDRVTGGSLMSNGQRSYVAEVPKAKIPPIDRDVDVVLEIGHWLFVPWLSISWHSTLRKKVNNEKIFSLISMIKWISSIIERKVVNEVLSNEKSQESIFKSVATSRSSLCEYLEREKNCLARVYYCIIVAFVAESNLGDFCIPKHSASLLAHICIYMISRS